MFLQHEESNKKPEVKELRGEGFDDSEDELEAFHNIRFYMVSKASMSYNGLDGGVQASLSNTPRFIVRACAMTAELVMIKLSQSNQSNRATGTMVVKCPRCLLVGGGALAKNTDKLRSNSRQEDSSSEQDARAAMSMSLNGTSHSLSHAVH